MSLACQPHFREGPIPRTNWPTQTELGDVACWGVGCLLGGGGGAIVSPFCFCIFFFLLGFRFDFHFLIRLEIFGKKERQSWVGGEKLERVWKRGKCDQNIF